MLEQNKFYKLDIIGASDISTKISDIFYNNTFVSNPDILDGIIDALSYFQEHNIDLSSKTHIRPAMQSLNALGGSIILDSMSKEEVTNYVVSCIKNILQGKGVDINVEEVNEYFEESASTSEVDAM